MLFSAVNSVAATPTEADNWDDLSCHAAQQTLSTLLPALVNALRSYREAALAGNYWARRNPEFLKLVYETALPPDDDQDALIAWSDRYGSNCRTPGLPSAYFGRRTTCGRSSARRASFAPEVGGDAAGKVSLIKLTRPKRSACATQAVIVLGRFKRKNRSYCQNEHASI